MANRNCNVASATAPGANCFKEAVCIDTRKIYDSCSDKDCLEDLLVSFTDEVQPIINSATSIKAKSVEILNVYLDVEPIPFNKGFYSVDITFFFVVRLSAFTCNMVQPVNVVGLASFTKKVILYGSEGGVKVFLSNQFTPAGTVTDMPNVTVQVTDPIILAARLVECCNRVPCGCAFPEEICGCFRGNFGNCQLEKDVYISIGLFTIIQMSRDVQLMIPTYDFCIPEKACESISGSEDPCELFRKIKFPTNSFFPPNLTDL